MLSFIYKHTFFHTHPQNICYFEREILLLVIKERSFFLGANLRILVLG